MDFKLDPKHKKKSRKAIRKQNRCKNILKKHEGLETVDTPTKYLFIGNGGLICGVQRETLVEIFSLYGQVQDVIMIPDKPYAFIIYDDEKHSEAAMKYVNGMKFDLKYETVFYLSFIKAIPKTDAVNTALPPGLIQIKDFISEEEETTLLNLINFDLDDDGMKHRRVKHFGYEFNYSNNNVNKEKPLDEKIPEICHIYLQRLLSLGHITRIPDQLTVNHYLPGQGIPPHTDTHSAFEDEIISLSLGSQVIMDFYHPEKSKFHLPVLLPRRSVIVMKGESRYLWKHGITPRKTDIVPVVDESNCCISLSYRETRTSFTFRCIRHIPCDCSFIMQCDSQKPKIEYNIVITEKEAHNLELEHVTKVYENIAHHFSETRYKPWPLVAKFIEDLPIGSILIDAGCGNGKNMPTHSNLFVVGCDVSVNLIKLCAERQLQTVVGDVLMLPFRDSCADVCVCIAVIHHLATEKRRQSAIKEIIRVLKTGGKALVYVWALEQETLSGPSNYLSHSKITKKQLSTDQNSEIGNTLSTEKQSTINTILPVHKNRTHFEQQDIFVPWHKKENSANTSMYQRYYHVFKEGELEALVAENDNITIKKSYYDKGNWCVLIEKT